MSFFRLAGLLSVGLFCTFIPKATVFASPINYGNLNALHVVYEQITEDSSTDPTPLFGAPHTSDDAMLFSPVSFGANALGAGGFDSTDGTLATTIHAIGNSHIEKLVFSERGDYTLDGTGSANTKASVATTFFVRITDVDGPPITPISFTASMTFNPSDGTYNLVDDPGFLVPWEGGVTLDITAALVQRGISAKATKVDLSLDNSLLARSEAGTWAYIKKKQIDGVSVTSIVDVPEPSTFALLFAGALGLAGLAWRRRTLE
jgi:hypothetical protein